MKKLSVAFLLMLSLAAKSQHIAAYQDCRQTTLFHIVFCSDKKHHGELLVKDSAGTTVLARSITIFKNRNEVRFYAKGLPEGQYQISISDALKTSIINQQ